MILARLEWRVAPAADGLPAALFATRAGLGSVCLQLDPDLLARSGWNYLECVAQEMTEALS